MLGSIKITFVFCFPGGRKAGLVLVLFPSVKNTKSQVGVCFISAVIGKFECYR